MNTTHNAKILGYPEWSTRGLEEACKKGEWPAWEEKALAHLIMNPNDGCREAIGYAQLVRRRPWHDLEVVLANPPRRWHQPHCEEWIPLYDYIKTMGRSPSLANLILSNGCGVPAFLYARYGLCHRWEEAEPLILGQETPASPALVPYGIIDEEDAILNGVGNSLIGSYASHLIGTEWPAFEQKVLNDDCHPLTVLAYVANVLRQRWEPAEAYLLRTHPSDALMCATVSYAEFVVRDRWEEAEYLLASSTKWMCQYARHVIGGRLPDHLHNAMVLNTPDDFVREYMAAYGASSSP